MAIQTLQDKGNSNLIQASQDGAVYRLAGDDCVLKGIGDEFKLNLSSGSLDVSFNAGSQAVLCGNFFYVKSLETITLPANSTIYLCARIDTTKANGSKGSFETLTNSQITKGNINGSDTIRDLVLYVITTDSIGVISIEDRRIIRELGGANILVQSLSAGNTSITFNDTNIHTNSIFSFYTSIYGVSPNEVYVNEGSVQLVFDAQATTMQVGVKIEGVY